MRPRICFDIDQVLATGTIEKVYSDAAGWAFEKCDLIPETLVLIEELWRRGVEIFLYSARFLEDREKTEWWLKKHVVPYDKLILGKPQSDLYVDDKNYPVAFDPKGEDHLESILRRLHRDSPKRSRYEPR